MELFVGEDGFEPSKPLNKRHYTHESVAHLSTILTSYKISSPLVLSKKFGPPGSNRLFQGYEPCVETVSLRPMLEFYDILSRMSESNRSFHMECERADRYTKSALFVVVVSTLQRYIFFLKYPNI